MSNLNKKSKIVVSSIATIFLIVLYVLIFSFSEQDGEASGGLSYMITEKFVELLNNLNGKSWSEKMMESMAIYFENPIRKLAHFCEYAVMGGLLFFIWYPWLGWRNADKSNTDKSNTQGTKVSKEKNGRKRKSVPLLGRIIIPWVFVSAAFDEIHQLFTPGRNGNFWDVLLDTAGGCFGFFLCIWLLKSREWRKKHKISRKERRRTLKK